MGDFAAMNSDDVNKFATVRKLLTDIHAFKSRRPPNNSSALSHMNMSKNRRKGEK